MVRPAIVDLKSLPTMRSHGMGPGRTGLGAATIMSVLLLVAMPLYALTRVALPFDWRFAALTGAVVSVITYVLYGADKRRAEAGRRRTPELVLHLADLLGGWPGGLLAQRRFRHKTAKLSFQCVFWLTVSLYQYLAIDALRGWALTTKTVRSLAAWLSQG